MDKYKRYIASFVVLTMIATFLSETALASTKNQEKKDNRPQLENTIKQEKNTIEENKIDEAKIIREVEEKREANVKQFLKDDMTYEAVVYPNPVHYLDNGKWKEIDNSLSEKKLNDNETVVENKTNNFKVKFAKNSTDKNLVQISKGDFEISWGIEGIQNSSCEVEKNDINIVNKQIEEQVLNKINKDKNLFNNTKEEKSKIKDILVENEKKKIIINDSSEVTYFNILDGIDLKYNLTGDNLKEDLIINKKIENCEFKFSLQTKN